MIVDNNNKKNRFNSVESVDSYRDPEDLSNESYEPKDSKSSKTHNINRIVSLDESVEYKAFKSDSCITWLIFGLLFCFLIVGCISYIVFGIKFLIEDYGIVNKCKDSNLWEYVLVTLILIFGNLKLVNLDFDSKSNRSSEVSHITILTAGFVSFGLAIWGGFELWNNSCKDLKESNLWSFGVLSFTLQIFETFLLLIFPPLIVFLIKCWLENDNYTVSNSRSNR